jgi:hypothetical protein
MELKRTLIFIIVFSFMPLSVVQAWSGKRDNKPIAELELMDDFEIAVEVYTVCIQSCIGAQVANKLNTPEAYDEAYQPHVDAREYVTLIGRVVRKKHQRMPDWMTRLQAALQANDTAAVRQVVDELGEKKEAAQKSQRAKSKQKAQQ